MRRLPAAIPILAGLLALYLLAPFVAGLARFGTADWAGADRRGLLSATAVSVASATLATAVVTLGGVPLGYVLARSGARSVAALGILVQLPLALPPLSSGVLLLFLLGYASPLGRWTGGRLTDSFAGIVLAEAFVAAPFLVIAARSAFAAIDPALEDVAATLGHKPAAVFRKVSLPIAARPILAGVLLAWLRAFGEFGATVMVAYHPYSLPVFTYVAFGSEGLPAMLPVLAPTLVAALGVLLLSPVVGRPRAVRNDPAATGDARPRPARPRPVADDRDGAPLAVEVHRHLPGFSLDVSWRSRARRLAVLGASGSGKSMTLRAIAGLDGAGQSAIRLGARALDTLPPERRGIAYLPQNYGLMPHLRVAEQLRFAADADPALARRWAARLGLDGLEERWPPALSLGQQQRVALGRALARPSVALLLLDEPFSALDASLRVRLREELLALQAEIAATTVLVTHDPAEAMLLADELLLLAGGRVLQAGPVAAVFARPANAEAARLLGAVPAGTGRVMSNGAIDLGDGVHLAVGGPPLSGLSVGWAVRPHQVRFDRSGRYPATVIERGAVRDGQRRVLIRLGAGILEVVADPSCPPEGSCRVTIDAEAVQVWPILDHEADALAADRDADEDAAIA